MFDLVRRPAVLGFTAFVILANAILLVLGRDTLSVQLAGESGFANVALFVMTGFFYGVILLVVHLVTRKRERPDFTVRTPVKAVAALETLWLWVYALIALSILGLGYGVGLHLPGSIFQPDVSLSVSYTLAWAAINFVLFAVIPYAVFRARGYSNVDLGLRSLNLRGGPAAHCHGIGGGVYRRMVRDSQRLSLLQHVTLADGCGRFTDACPSPDRYGPAHYDFYPVHSGSALPQAYRFCHGVGDFGRPVLRDLSPVRILGCLRKLRNGSRIHFVRLSPVYRCRHD